jgi:hypothetical protein
MPIDAAMQQAIDAFAPDAEEISNVGGRAHLVKFRSGERWIRVRRWSEESTRQRVALVASLRAALTEAETATAPRPVASPNGGDLFIEQAGRFYEAQEWREGRSGARKAPPLDLRDHAMHAPANLPGDALPQLAAALAETHLATAALISPSAPSAPLGAVLAAVGRQWRDDHALLRRQALQHTILQRWIRATEQAMPEIENALTAVDFLSQTDPVIARFNVWPAHLLFTRSEGKEQLTTLLDPSASAVSSPLIDIAQAITHGSGWTTAAAEIGLAAYADVRRLTPDERRLLPAVAALDLVAETGRLLRIAHGGGRDADWEMADFARNGATAALVSLETVLPAIRRATESGPLFKARPWIRRPRPDAGPREKSAPRRNKTGRRRNDSDS